MRYFKYAMCLGVFICSLSYSIAQSSGHKIKLKSATISPDEMQLPEMPDRTQLAKYEFGGHYYVILQFEELPDAATQKSLKAKGIELMSYLPDYAYQARIRKSVAPFDLTGMRLSGWVPISGNMKLSRALAAQNYPDHALSGRDQIDLAVLGYPGNGLAQLRSAVERAGFQTVEEPGASTQLVVRVPLDDIQLLADLPAVMYLEATEAPPVPDGLRGRTLHRANLLSGAPGTGYDGTGVVIGIADDGGVNHIDFQGRLTDNTSNPGGTHGDMVSGIACGAGNISPIHIGMATGAYLQMYDIGGYPHVINAIANFSTLGTVVTSTSYSQGCGGVYNSTAVDLDADVYTQNELLHVFSAGNSAGSTCSSVYGSITVPTGGYYGNITGGRKAAKSSIATANMEFDDDRTSSSSRGPCEDGRLKPDISAMGTGQLTTAPNNTYQTGGGTSAACPGIAGVSAMLYQAYRDNNGGANPASSLIKASLLNTADDLGRAGPDYDFGWGRVNARRAVDVIENATYINGSVANGSTNNHIISVPSGIHEVRIMVYWLDPAGSATAAKALVNDLNMNVSVPGGTIYHPWVLSAFPALDSIQRLAWRGQDDRNNMEQVTLTNPPSGNFTVSVNGYAVPSGPQNYHVVYHFVENDIKVTYPNGGEGLDPGTTEILRWDAPAGTGNFTIEYTTDNGSSWNTISSGYSGAERFYSWSVPANVTQDARIRVTRGSQSDQSDGTFSIIDVPGNFSLTSSGATTATASWTAVTGADSYEVFALGTSYMQSLGTTTTNSFTVTGLTAFNSNWYAVRALITGGGEGRRCNGIEYQHTSGTGGCPGSTVTSFPYSEGFESGLGDWVQSTADDINWTRQSGGTSSSNTGPTGASEGSFYVYTEASSPNFPSKLALLEGPCLDLTGFSSAELTFAYDMFGAAMGTLNVEISDDNGVTWTNEWTLSGDQGNAWNNATVDLSSYAGSTIRIRFAGTTGTSFTSDIAVDDIEVDGTSGGTACTSSITSFPANQGFESGFADWEQEAGDDFDWSTRSGSTPSTATGPTAASEGTTYIYTESSSPNFPSKDAIVKSPCYDLTGLSSPELRFSYHMYGATMGTLDIQVSTDGGLTWASGFFTLSGDQGNSWFDVQLSLSGYVSAQTRFRLVGTTSTSFTSDMAIDDWQVVDNFTCSSTISSYPWSEGFESGFGGWDQGTGDDMNWTRQSGGTSSQNTGPTAASQGSFYLYTESSSPNFPSKLGLLYGPCFNLNPISNPEFSFDYHMYGAAMGTLSLQGSTNNGGSWTTLWSQSGDQGNSWQTANVDLSAYTSTTIWLRWSGLTGSSFTSDMSIDNLKLESSGSSPCPLSVNAYPYFEDFDGFTLCGNTTFACNPDGNCSLTAGWTNLSGDAIDWSVDDLATPSSSTGPSSDHTSGSGKFLYTEASSCYNNAAFASSPCFDLGSLSNPELVFWYHMYGTNIGTLSVRVSTNGGASFGSPIWTLSGNQGNAWAKATVSLAAYAGQYVIFRFDGTTGSSWQGDMAIDDFGVGESGFAKTQAPAAASALTSGKDIVLYPNPAQDMVSVRLAGFEGQVTWRVFDMYGRAVAQSPSEVNAPEMLDIDLSEMADGYYLVEVRDLSGIATRRLVIQK